MEPNDDQSDLLSPELREALGTNGLDIVLPGKKKKKSHDPNKQNDSEEVKTLAKKLSKAQKRKLEQLEAKKVKESKRGDLYQDLSNSALSENQLQLLLSSRQIGQNLTTKQRLAKAYQRHQAGLTLTEEEHRLLFPEPLPEDASTEQVPMETPTPASSPAPKAAPKVVEVSATKLPEKPSEEAGGAKSWASKILSNLHKLQQSTASHQAPARTTPAKPKASQPKESESEDSDSSDSSDEENDGAEEAAEEAEPAAEEPPTDEAQPYVPVPMVLPKCLSLRDCDVMPVSDSQAGTAKDGKPIGHTRHIVRDPVIHEARMKLPVCQMEQEIVEAISDNDVVILCGETGSGKSTQVPQFLYEAGYTMDGKMIGITQPRRVAAISTAQRVATELSTECGRHGFVSYQIRYDNSTVSSNTEIKFMTDGILLKEVTTDLLLRQYSAVLLDEAHERNINTDVLLGLLSRAVHMRREISRQETERWNSLSEEEKAEYEKPIAPLKLVVMSATLRVSDFVDNRNLFHIPPPVLRVESRQYPVTIHFDKRTELQDYVEAAFAKVCKIHRRLPEGGILVFLTGKREILHLCAKLRQEFQVKKQRKSGTKSTEASEFRKNRTGEGDLHKAEEKGSDLTQEYTMREMDDDEDDADFEEVINRGLEDDYDNDSSNDEQDQKASDGEGDGNEPSDDEEEQAQLQMEPTAEKDPGDAESKDASDETDAPKVVGPVIVLPLFAMLSPVDQAKVFKDPPPNHRMIVVATNVAETSITIPGIKYVVDCGRVKERVMDIVSGISTYKVQWTSQASADQRAGRSGRTGPGHCYRLYSSAFYNQHMKKFADAEILNRPLEDIILQMKAIGIRDVEKFPFPTPPPSSTLSSATRLLANLGALDKDTLEITPLGKALAHFPLNPRYAKMLILGQQAHVLSYAIVLVSMLVERSPFMFTGDQAEEETEESQAKEESSKSLIRQARARWSHPTSDALARLRAAGAYAFVARPRAPAIKAREFCAVNFLHEPTMSKSLELRKQLTRIANDLYRASGEAAVTLDYDMRPPNPNEELVLRQIIAASSTDCIAKLAPVGTVTTGSKLRRRCAYISCDSNVTEPIYIHSHSYLYSNDPSQLPDWISYGSLVRSETSDVTFMTCVTSIDAAWLPKVAKDTPMLKLSKPLTSPPPYYDPTQDGVLCYVTPSYGHHGWELPPISVPLATAEGTSSLQEMYRWFARMLLTGAIVPELAALHVHGHLSDSPTIITSKQPSAKVASLVTALSQKGVSSRSAFVEQLRSNHSYLRNELLQWIKAGSKQEFTQIWNQIIVKFTKSTTKQAAAKSSAGVMKPSHNTTKAAASAPKATQIASNSSTSSAVLNRKRPNVVVVDASATKKKKR